MWGELWHVDGIKRLPRNSLLRARDTNDYTFTEWIFGRTAVSGRGTRAGPVVPLGSVEPPATDEVHQTGLVPAG